MGTPKAAAAGAAFFTTNDPSGNFVVSADIGSDGKLTLRQAVSTGGNGSHGNSSDSPVGLGPDALFSQGAVKTNNAVNVLATVNSGSNTVSLFSVSPKDPAVLNSIGNPADSGGEFPMSLAINAAGTQACVLNGGAKNGVSCMSIDPKKGLTPQTNNVRSLGLNQTTPPSGPAGTTSHIVFNEDGTQLIASVKGVPPQPGFFAIWNVSSDGTLSQNFQKLAPNQGGLLPFSMTVIKGQNALLATDAGVGFDIVDLANMTPANKSSVVPIQGQGATCWSSHSEKTGNFYLTDIGTNQVTEVNVDKNLKGTIVKQYSQGTGVATIDNDIVSLANNDFMYVLAANATALHVLSLNAPGQAQNIQTLDVAGPAKSVGLPLSANFVQGMTAFVKK